jgi:hypothetical protein
MIAPMLIPLGANIPLDGKYTALSVSAVRKSMAGAKEIKMNFTKFFMASFDCAN